MGGLGGNYRAFLRRFLLFFVGFVLKFHFLGKLDDDTADADLVEGADPIGDIFGDLLKGAGALLTEGIKIVTDVTDGSVSSVSTSYSSNLTACTVIVKHF